MPTPRGTNRTPSTADAATLTELRRALDRFATEILVFVSAKGELLASNRYVTLGYEGEEQAGRHIAEHLHPDDLTRVFDLVERARRTPGFSERLVVRARHRDGSWRVLDATVLDAREVSADVDGVVIRARDITDEQQTLPLGESVVTGTDDDRFLSLAEALPLGILSADARGYVVFANDAAVQLFNLPIDELSGFGWERSILDEDRPDVTSAIRTVVDAGIPQEATFRVATGLFQRWAHAKFVPLGDERRTGWIATVEDVTERRRAESHLAHLATHDPLTRLPNRLLLEDRLRQALARLRRDADSITVMFCDLDGFKGVNDEHGHTAGDRILVEVARRIRDAVRDTDTVARLGGDEFVVICEAMADDEAEEVARRIAESVRHPTLVGTESIAVGVSVGVVVTDDPELDVTELLSRADQAMYRVKHGANDAPPHTT